MHVDPKLYTKCPPHDVNTKLFQLSVHVHIFGKIKIPYNFNLSLESCTHNLLKQELLIVVNTQGVGYMQLQQENWHHKWLQ
jgi:hypothetical protein